MKWWLSWRTLGFLDLGLAITLCPLIGGVMVVNTPTVSWVSPDFCKFGEFVRRLLLVAMFTKLQENLLRQNMLLRSIDTEELKNTVIELVEKYVNKTMMKNIPIFPLATVAIGAVAAALAFVYW